MDLPVEGRPQPSAEVGHRRHLGKGLHRAARPGGRRRRSRPSRRGSTPRSSAPTSTPPGPSKGAPAGEPDDHVLGRSRSGLTTKIRLSADSRCQPLAFVLTPGQTGDAPAFPQVMNQLRVPRPIGRPWTTADAVLADKAYSSRAIRTRPRRRRRREFLEEFPEGFGLISTAGAHQSPGSSVTRRVAVLMGGAPRTACQEVRDDRPSTCSG
ncbi:MULTISPECIES: transposase [Streptomyces]|uniref:transposase n=1 Tax=Streptomyces TaxID=1883 RepID=UPI000D1B7698|nr:transposase [Streptomyces sp. CB00271]